jgi:Na+/proline symporter
MKAVLVTVGAGVCVAALLPQMPVHRLLADVPALASALLFLVAVAVGILTTRRAWLAAACAYLLGFAVWVVTWLRPSPPWDPSDVWYIEKWVQFLLTNGLISAAIFATAAAVAHFTAISVGRRLSRQTPS